MTGHILFCCTRVVQSFSWHTRRPLPSNRLNLFLLLLLFLSRSTGPGTRPGDELLEKSFFKRPPPPAPPCSQVNLFILSATVLVCRLWVTSRQKSRLLTTRLLFYSFRCCHSGWQHKEKPTKKPQQQRVQYLENAHSSIHCPMNVVVFPLHDEKRRERKGKERNKRERKQTHPTANPIFRPSPSHNSQQQYVDCSHFLSTTFDFFRETGAAQLQLMLCWVKPITLRKLHARSCGPKVSPTDYLLYSTFL